MAPRTTIDQMIEPVLQVVANPCKLWDSGNLKLRRLSLKLVFADQLSYSRERGYRTAKTSNIFNMLEDLTMGKSEMVPPSGLEPELLSERHFECRASTNSTRGARFGFD